MSQTPAPSRQTDEVTEGKLKFEGLTPIPPLKFEGVTPIPPLGRAEVAQSITPHRCSPLLAGRGHGLDAPRELSRTSAHRTFVSRQKSSICEGQQDIINFVIGNGFGHV